MNLLKEWWHNFRGCHFQDTIKRNEYIIKHQRESINKLSEEYMDLVYQIHGKEGTKLNLKLHRKIQSELDKRFMDGDGKLDITTTNGTLRHADNYIVWCDMPDREKVTYYRAGYVVPRNTKVKL